MNNQPNDDLYAAQWEYEAVDVTTSDGERFTRLIPRDWEYGHDPNVPLYVKGGRLKVGDPITAKCMHPECGNLFTYRYGVSPEAKVAKGGRGGPVRKYCSLAHSSDYQRNGHESADGTRSVTYTDYRPPSATKTLLRKVAFKLAAKLAHQWADEHDRVLRSLLRSMEPGTERTLTAEEAAAIFSHPYMKPATPEPGTATSVTIVITPEGQRRDREASPLDPQVINALMGKTEHKRALDPLTGQSVREENLERRGWDHTDSTNDGRAAREEAGSSATASVDPEAVDPLFREQAGGSFGGAGATIEPTQQTTGDDGFEAASHPNMRDASRPTEEAISDIEKVPGALTGGAVGVGFQPLLPYVEKAAFGWTNKFWFIKRMRRSDPGHHAYLAAEARRVLAVVAGEASPEVLEALFRGLSSPEKSDSGNRRQQHKDRK